MRVVAAALCSAALLWPGAAFCWGDAGHRVVALIAEQRLSPAVRSRVLALLANDDTGLVARDIASQATWADAWRDRTTEANRERTRRWHFVNLALGAPDLAPNLAVACPAGAAPSRRPSEGPAADCVVHKITQFRGVLRDPATPLAERRRALQFLLHLVGDIHQPLHAADDHDRGGNDKTVLFEGRPVTLHAVWDQQFVTALGRDPQALATRLARAIDPADARAWSAADAPATWARESLDVARQVAYRPLPPAQNGAHRLDERYAEGARRAVALQLQKAGVRLAALLEATLLDSPPRDAPISGR